MVSHHKDTISWLRGIMEWPWHHTRRYGTVWWLQYNKMIAGHYEVNLAWWRRSLMIEAQRDECKAQWGDLGIASEKGGVFDWSTIWWMQDCAVCTLDLIGNKRTVCPMKHFIMDESHWGVKLESHREQRHTLTTEALYDTLKALWGDLNTISVTKARSNVWGAIWWMEAVLSDLSTLRTIWTQCVDFRTMQWEVGLYSERRSIRLVTCQARDANSYSDDRFQVRIRHVSLLDVVDIALRPFNVFIKLRSQLDYYKIR